MCNIWELVFKCVTEDICHQYSLFKTFQYNICEGVSLFFNGEQISESPYLHYVLHEDLAQIQTRFALYWLALTRIIDTLFMLKPP